MNKALILASCLFLTTQLTAQQKPATVSLADTIFLTNNVHYLYKQSMPNAYKANPSHKAIVQGNNATGFDIYILPTDKMPCLVPDKNNLANMPNSINCQGLNAEMLQTLIQEIEKNNANKQLDLLLKSRKESKLLFPLPKKS